MSEETELRNAENVFKTLCELLDDNGWHYDRDDENLLISCGVNGDDLPIDIKIEVDRQRQIVALYSEIPLTVSKDRRAVLAIAVNQANCHIADGSFDYDYLNGKILFRITSSYRESIIGKGLLGYMVACACYTVDRYNDKFLMVAKRDMTLKEILEFIA